MYYRILNVTTKQVIASDLSTEGVEKFWNKGDNRARFTGIRAVNLDKFHTVIEVQSDETNAKSLAIINADAELSNAGLPTYSEVLMMLREARSLGLTFERGTAYISAAYIETQTALRERIGPACNLLG